MRVLPEQVAPEQITTGEPGRACLIHVMFRDEGERGGSAETVHSKVKLLPMLAMAVMGFTAADRSTEQEKGSVRTEV